MRNLVLGDYQGRVYVVNPAADVRGGDAGLRHASPTSPTRSTSRSWRSRPTRCPDVVLDCAAKGVHGLVVISAGFAETGEEGRQRQRRLVRAGPQLRAAADRPERLGIINTAADVHASTRRCRR